MIAPHFDYAPDARYHDAWEKDQNANCWREFRVLRPVLDTLPKPPRILEIGPGLGRSLVFFSRKLYWRDAELHAYEGEGTATRVHEARAALRRIRSAEISRRCRRRSISTVLRV